MLDLEVLNNNISLRMFVFSRLHAKPCQIAVTRYILKNNSMSLNGFSCLKVTKEYFIHLNNMEWIEHPIILGSWEYYTTVLDTILKGTEHIFIIN